MPYVITIPSYKRSEQCNNKTLKFLHQSGIPKDKIYVFCVESEYLTYKHTLNPDWYNMLVIGKEGIIPQREFIKQFFDEYERIVGMDDDVENIDLSMTDYWDLDDFILSAFDECDKQNAFIWGTYPVYNPFYRITRPHLSTKLSHILYTVYGFINRKYDDDLRPKTVLACGNKDDTENSILYYLKDGKVLRFNRVGVKTKNFLEGGMGTINDRIDAYRESSILLNNKYPDITKIRIRKNGLYEIVLRERPPKNPKPTKKQNDVDINIPDPEILPIINKNETESLLSMLQKKTIPLNSNNSGRSASFGTHRATPLGFIKGRFTKKYELSSFSKKNPKIYQEVLRIGKLICPFEFESIYLNHNVVCPRHLDPYNSGESVIFSIGEYEGGELVIEGYGEFNINHTPIKFDGGKSYHWNKNIISGNKYSLVFFNTNDRGRVPS
jgi:hypothetical protein